MKTELLGMEVDITWLDVCGIALIMTSLILGLLAFRRVQ